MTLVRPALVAVLAAVLAAGCPDGPRGAGDDAGPRPLGDAGPQVDAGPGAAPRPALIEPRPAEDLDPAEGVLQVELRAAPHPWSAAGVEVDGYAFNGQVPGPTLRLQVGDRLIVDLINELDHPTTIHWHGVELPWAMDGAVWMLDPVPPGGTFRYDFVVTRPGTFWYHPHFDTARQVDRGLFGALVVEDPADPAVDRDIVLIVDDVAEVDEDAEPVPRLEPTWAVNGLAGPALLAAGPMTVRARVINVSNRAYLDLGPPGLRRIGGDQGLLGIPVEGEATLLAPGDRAELELRLGGQDLTLSALPTTAAGPGPGEGSPLLYLDVDEDADPPAPADFGAGEEAPSAAGASELLYVFSGDDSTGEWRINGEAYPDITVREVPAGEPVQVTVRNVSSRDHPFHIHGMRFEVLSVAGEVPAQRQWEDTLNVPIHADAVILLHPGEPGEWMLHCHILSHAEGGMMTVLRVAPAGG